MAARRNGRSIAAVEGSRPRRQQRPPPLIPPTPSISRPLALSQGSYRFRKKHGGGPPFFFFLLLLPYDPLLRLLVTGRVFSRNSGVYNGRAIGRGIGYHWPIRQADFYTRSRPGDRQGVYKQPEAITDEMAVPFLTRVSSFSSSSSFFFTLFIRIHFERERERKKRVRDEPTIGKINNKKILPPSPQSWG